MSAAEPLTPAEMVRELDRHVVGQGAAKRAVAVALRNRWRRLQLPPDRREESMAANVLMIGPTGVGKTEIARRVARLVGAPFVKVEATRFTEVGYIGRDVESMVRDLAQAAVQLVERELRGRARQASREQAVELVLEALQQESPSGLPRGAGNLRAALLRGELDALEIRTPPELQVSERTVEGWSDEEGRSPKSGGGWPSWLGRAGRSVSRMAVSTALERLTSVYVERALAEVDVDALARERACQQGIIFVDELDKLVGQPGQNGPDVSRSGVQRDLLPIVEGCLVETPIGMVDTRHVLFIAAGAFHQHAPSELMPELQGRFPVRVELTSLGRPEFSAILSQPDLSPLARYVEMLEVEGVRVRVEAAAVEEIATLVERANDRLENIGARRLHTVLEKVFDELSFHAPELRGREITVDAEYVRTRVAGILEDEDLLRYIL
jgi:ATP-dependent HslUV protease ATP-binding subunit HslU